MSIEKQRKPDWLRVRVPQGDDYVRLKKLIRATGLHTVCEEALCPNLGECWNAGRATVMILGDKCTRDCTFCNVGSYPTSGCDPHEPERVASALKGLHLKQIVITSVTRDDMPDHGAAIWAKTIELAQGVNPELLVEVLVPDFGGDWKCLRVVLDARPYILGHNLETVSELYPALRPSSDYQRSLELLKRAHDFGLTTKTAIMLGVGESKEQILRLMDDALAQGCSIFYIGQYLQPTREHYPVQRYVHPDEFCEYEQLALKLGFKSAVAGPLVRSSYHRS